MDRKIKVVLFDIDGTLVDSERMYNLCWRRAATELGYDLTVERSLELRSLDSQLAQELFLDWFHDPLAYSAVRKRRRELMADSERIEPITAKTGIEQLVNWLNEKKVKIAIVTSNPLERAKEYLEKVHLDSYFDVIISTEFVKRGKPFPDVYTYAVQKMGIPAYQCLAVEDSPNGLKSAHDAGCRTVMIPDLSPFTEDLKDYVDWCVPSLLDIIHDARIPFESQI